MRHILAFTLLLSVLPRLWAWDDEKGGRSAPLAVPAKGAAGFTKLDPAETGLDFLNALPDDVSLNGAGVALGDFDNDGRCDVYLRALHGRSALFKNLGDWKFQDVTAGSGVECEGEFGKGSCFVDLNGDGKLDLVTTANVERKRAAGGLRCFLGDGAGRFRETTAEAGLTSNFGSNTVAAADVDADGDLDLYVSNAGTSERDELKLGYHERIGGERVYSWVRYDGAGKVTERVDFKIVGDTPQVPAGFEQRFFVDENKQVKELGPADLLLLNDGRGNFARASWTDGRFRDEDGRTLAQPPLDFGLAATFRDFNGDGASDIYVCNDFHTPDRLWFGDGKGGFRAAPRLALRTLSFASMGVDVADLDRDGHADFFVAEMLARTHERRKRQMGAMKPTPLAIGQIENRPQIMRNTLFLNRGDATWAEIAPFAGVTSSEWSWQPVFLDVDLDGFEDIVISNGYGRDLMDADAANELAKLGPEERAKALDVLPVLKVPKVAFRNRGDLTFEEVGAKWGLGEPAIGHGIAEADLDGDGDLDLVMNMYRERAAVFRNDSPAPRVAVRLRGRGANGQAIGAKVTLRGGAVAEQAREMFCGGRYLSGGQPQLCFATGKAAGGMTLEVVWRSGVRSVIEGVRANRVYEIAEPAAGETPAGRLAGGAPAPPLFEDFSAVLAHTHHENEFDDFARQLLLPNRLSQLGPGLAWCDLDGDGRDDLIVGSGRGGALAVRLHDGQKGFKEFKSEVFKAPADFTGVAAWRDGTGTMHLFAGLANFEDENAQRAAVRGWELGRGSGKTLNAAPGASASTGPIAFADVEGDGDLDLFVGGRSVPGRYPEPANSRLFRNAGEQFVADEAAGALLKDVGLVSGAVFSDLTGDGFPELVLAMEWGPVRVFQNDGKGSFSERTAPLGLAKYSGWWNGVTTGDLDGDGRLDIVATNWGLNSKYHPKPGHPLLVYFGEFDVPGRLDVIEAHHDMQVGRLVPERGYSCSSQAMPFLKKTIGSYERFGQSGLEDLYGDRLKTAPSLQAGTLEHMVFFNRGDCFEGKALPIEAQFAPAFGVSVADLDGDGHEDVVLAQNFFAAQIETPRSDAGRSLVLRGDGRGGLRALPGHESGLLVHGDARGLAVGDFDGDCRPDVAIGQNGAATKLFRNVRAQPGLRVALTGPAGNSQAFGAVVRLRFGERFGPAREIHGGSGFWSQDSATPVLGGNAPTAIWVRWPGGREHEQRLVAGQLRATLQMP